MRDFDRSLGRLRRLSLHARLVYTVFLVFTLAGLGLSAWLGEQMVGPDLSEMDAYYAGASQEVQPAPEPIGGPEIELGPELDLPADAELGVAGEPMSTRKLLEVTHFHLFSMPVYLLILSHLFMLTGAGSRAKVAWISAGSAGVALHIAAPWMATGGGSLSAILFGVSGAVLLLAFLWMSLLPLWEMWRPHDPSS